MRPLEDITNVFCHEVCCVALPPSIIINTFPNAYHRNTLLFVLSCYLMAWDRRFIFIMTMTLEFQFSLLGHSPITIVQLKAFVEELLSCFHSSDNPNFVMLNIHTFLTHSTTRWNTPHNKFLLIRHSLFSFYVDILIKFMW